jgi:hypothetical protein
MPCGAILRRDLVVVHDRREAEYHRHRHRRQQHVEPQRLGGHFVALARAALLHHAAEQHERHQRRDHPARGGADAAVVAAAQALEEFVVHRLRLAVGHQEGRAAERHQAAERDHERRHAEHRREPALVDRHQQRHREPRQAGRGPRPAGGVLQVGDEHADEAHDRADRQVDVARHDDQHHHGRDDAHHGRLLRDVVEVLGREKHAARHDAEDHAIDDQQHAHQDQPQVDARAAPPAGVWLLIFFRSPSTGCAAPFRRAHGPAGHAVRSPGRRLHRARSRWLGLLTCRPRVRWRPGRPCRARPS